MTGSTEVSYLEQIKTAAAFVQSKLGGVQPVIGLILGSGLGDLAEQVESPIYIDYHEVPYFPVSTVEGHAGQFVVETLEGKPVIVMQGRFHFYEGYSMRKCVFPVYVMKQLGVDSLVITNAAGGMNRSFSAGDLMLITDHINLTGANPLIGKNDAEFGVRFPDMSEAYSRSFGELAYMTPAELTMLARIGGDAVGMSTVGEVIAACHAGMRVLGLSCITDMAIGDELEPLTHEQVVAVANKTKPKFIGLVKAFVREVQL